MNDNKDAFGNRMKIYESITTGLKLIPGLPVCVRLDGKSFHTFTKNMAKPYDMQISNSMMNTMKYLVDKTNATIGYTQSDEITLIYIPDENKQINFFDGKLLKLTSILSAMCTAKFNNLCRTTNDDLAFFDCRVWNVPTYIEAVNVLAWREFDAIKNSISTACFSVYSDKECINKHSGEKLQMLLDKDIDWNNYPTFFKRGIYASRISFNRKLTQEELNSLPEKHNARKNPDMIVSRSKVMFIVPNKNVSDYIKLKSDDIFNEIILDSLYYDNYYDILYNNNKIL